MSGAFGPVADYVPHRPPMLMIEEIVDVTAERAICRTTIRPDCVFAIEGQVHPSAMIEFVGQACAIWAGVTSAREGKPPRTGFIVSCREVAFTVNSFAVGDELTIVATKILGEHQLAAFDGTVTRDDQICVTIQLSVVDAELAGGPSS